jgi:hemoglobin
MAIIFPRRSAFNALAAFAMVAVLAASPVARADDSLYQALGELPGITAIVDTLLVSTDVDPRIQPFFEGVSHKRLRQKLIEQFCALSGGPCRYTGRSMRESHKGLGINQTAFNALVEDLQAAMDKQHVAYHAQNRLLALLAPMSREIIEK